MLCPKSFLALAAALTVVASSPGFAQGIPAAAFSRTIGEPFPGAMKAFEGIDDGPWQGVPIGGLGAGSIGRTSRGDFARWHLDVGQHLFRPSPPDQWSVRVQPAGGPARSRVLSVYRPEDGTLSGWGWDTTVRPENRYHALFPKAWFRYSDLPVEVECLQFSPFIPRNYQVSSYPVGIFRWRARNRGPSPVTVSLLFTWENKLGWWQNTAVSKDPFDEAPPYQPRWGQSEGDFNSFRSEPIEGGVMKGVVQSRKTGESLGEITEEWDGQYVMAVLGSPGVEASFRTRFDPAGDGAEVWRPFSEEGKLGDSSDERPAARGERVASALAVQFTLKPGEEREVPFVLAWDLPIMEFEKGAKWYKRYTKFFGRSGRNGWAIAREALLRQAAWEREIDGWMAPILADTRTPTWYKTALFNELYALIDLGTAWEDGKFGTTGGTDYPPLGRFSYLECFDYRFYSTLDVNAYASFAALLLYPELDKQEAKLFADAVDFEDLSEHPIGWTDGKERRPRKLRGTVPMDLGVPGENPWLRTNFYTWQDPNTLKDESSNLALKAWRDFAFTGKTDLPFLRHVWPQIQKAMESMRKFDRDGDGLLESEGVPDQTYDSWSMTGPSAYLGSLWLASLEACAAIADALGDQAQSGKYRADLATARSSYEAKLWNGVYYDFDTGSRDRKAIMADQLFGEFYAQISGLPGVVPPAHRESVLKTVFEKNVLGYQGGRRGAVNGVLPDGSVDRMEEKSNSFEVWTGVTYALAAFLVLNHQSDAGWKTAEGIYRTTYETGGLWFRTPEGWTDQRGALEYRASMYMRPLAVWAIQAALSEPPK